MHTAKPFQAGIAYVGILTAFWLLIETPAKAVTTMPLVGCPTDKAYDSGTPNTPSNIRSVKTDLPPAIAKELAIYESAHQMLVGPRGWHCAGWGGQAVVGLEVYPEKQDSEGNYREVLVYQIAFKPADDAELIAYAERYFPVFFKKYSDIIFSVNGNGVAKSDVPDLPDFSSDVLYYKTPVLTTFLTPAGQLGIGASILNQSFFGPLRAPKSPTFGFLRLVTGIGEEKPVCDLSEFAALLPPKFLNLSSTIDKTVEATVPVNCDY